MATIFLLPKAVDLPSETVKKSPLSKNIQIGEAQKWV